MMIVTLTKLLVISIVARVRSESSLNILILESLTVCSSSIIEISLGDSEKNAISDADIIPETYKRKTINIKETYTPNVGEYTSILLNKFINKE
jgi:hypothetical protein